MKKTLHHLTYYKEIRMDGWMDVVISINHSIWMPGSQVTRVRLFWACANFSLTS